MQLIDEYGDSVCFLAVVGLKANHFNKVTHGPLAQTFLAAFPSQERLDDVCLSGFGHCYLFSLEMIAGGSLTSPEWRISTAQEAYLSTDAVSFAISWDQDEPIHVDLFRLRFETDDRDLYYVVNAIRDELHPSDPEDDISECELEELDRAAQEILRKSKHLNVAKFDKLKRAFNLPDDDDASEKPIKDSYDGEPFFPNGLDPDKEPGQ